MIPMKSRDRESMIDAYTQVYTKLESLGHKPKLHILDNECSTCIKNFPCSAPQSLCQCSGTSRQNCKVPSHYGTGDARLELPNPTVEQDDGADSGHTQHVQSIKKWHNKNSLPRIGRRFDWNATPIASLETKGSVFTHPDNPNTFAPHCDNGYTVDRCNSHYQLLSFYIQATSGYQHSGTYRLYPQHCRMFTISKEDRTVEAAANLLTRKHEKRIASVSKSKQQWLQKT